MKPYISGPFSIIFILCCSILGSNTDSITSEIILPDSTIQITDTPIRKCPNCDRVLSDAQPVCPVCPINYTTKTEAINKKISRIPVSIGLLGGINLAAMFGSEIDKLEQMYSNGP